MPAPSIVRRAQPADHTEIWRLFLQGHRENGKFALAPEKCEYFISRALYPDAIPEWDTGPRPTIAVIGEVGALEAIAILAIGSMWYSHERHLEEFVVFVDPECRRGGFHARAMIDWMKSKSDLTGLPLLSGIISTERTEAKVRLYRRMMPAVGAFFLYGGKGTTSASSAAFA